MSTPILQVLARSAITAILTLAALSGVMQPALAAPLIAAPTLPVCSNAMQTGQGATAEEIAAHRKQPVPTLGYPFGSHPEGGWGVFLTLKINESGQVVCYRIKDQYGRNLPLNEERRAVVEQAKDWRYAPFTQDQHPASAMLVEHIGEEEQPKAHVTTPDGPPQTVHLRLERGLCQGGCPDYSVEISGDGQVVYRGEDYVDVLGEHHYTVPPEDVAQLVQKLRTADLWSLRQEYIFYVSGAPTYGLTIRIGSGRRQLLDYAGEQAGMPQAVTDFENEIDRVARSDMWIALTADGLAQLKKESFDFHSRQGGALLARAVAGDRDEAVLLDLVSLGAPLTTALDPDDRLPEEETLTLLDQALLNGQGALADALISRGALQPNGKLDPRRLDVAFRAAIIGGKLAPVQKIWDAGQGRHPSLTYVQWTGRGPSRPLPVSLLLSPERRSGKPWEGLAIVKWLEAQGCDIKAASPEGINLLHVAVTASDMDLVRYLLSKGLKDTTAASGASLLQNAHDEQTALLLLTSGTSHPPAGDAGQQYRTYIESQRWTRVAEWLKTHRE